MESHTKDDNSITTEERDENSSEEEQSSITTENGSEEQINPRSTLINDAASKVRDHYNDILQALLMEVTTKFVFCIPKEIGRCLHG